jgi:hemerythrin superfamily protein
MTQRPETMPETDGIDLLVRQHQEIHNLFQEVEQNTGHRRAEAFDRLRRFLAVHETAEEEIVHPLARRSIPHGDRVIQARLEEENKSKRMLQELERMGPADPRFEPLFARFRTAVRQHAEHEEQEEFPALKARGNAELRGLAAAIKAAEAMAPTHPHPGVESATKNMLVGSVAAVADRTRDMIRKALGREHR